MRNSIRLTPSANNGAVHEVKGRRFLEYSNLKEAEFCLANTHSHSQTLTHRGGGERQITWEKGSGEGSGMKKKIEEETGKARRKMEKRSVAGVFCPWTAMLRSSSSPVQL